jgi:FlaG/FlaF family flagellin (archaellin)
VNREQLPTLADPHREALHPFSKNTKDNEHSTQKGARIRPGQKVEIASRSCENNGEEIISVPITKTDLAITIKEGSFVNNFEAMQFRDDK